MCKKLLVFVLMLGLVSTAIGQVAGVDDPSDMADSSGDIKRVEAWVDGGNLNLTMTVYGVVAPSIEDTPADMSNRYYYHWILDTDNDPATGFLNDAYEGNPTNLETPIGADVVVMLGWRDGNPNGVEVYDPLTEEILLEDFEYTVDGDTIHAVIPLEVLGLTPDKTIAVSAFQEGASNDWQVDWVESFELALTAEAPASKPTIAWVSYHAADDEPHADAAAVGFTQAPDIGYTDLLKANGYDVTRVLTSQTPDVEYLNTFDLVIISRTASSGHYSGTGATAWNSITAPMINLNGYTLRSSRLGFTDGTDMPDTTGDIQLAVTDPTHPIFAGISITDGVMDNMYAEGAVPLPTDPTIISRGISINNNTLDEEGTLLATVAEVSADTGPVGGMVIAELPAGATLQNSSGSPEDVLGGPRLVFLTGSREPSGVTGGQAAALYDLYPDGEKMFLNAVAYMIPPERVVVLSEDFEGLPLGPSIDEEVAGEAVWTDTPPEGWIVDESGIPGIGDPATDGVTEWAGWAFADKAWWTETAGDQDRSLFVLGSGIVAIADPDEWDDADRVDTPIADDPYDTWLSTPEIDISGLEAGSLELKFDSSWRPEFDSNYHQTASISASYDGAEPVVVLLWESDESSANYKPYATNETVTVDLQNPAGAKSVVLTIGLYDAGNDWWWAIDNLEVSGLPAPEPIGPKVILVSDGYDDNADGAADDLEWVSILEAEGYIVDYQINALGDGYWRTLDDDKIAALNAADLIIVSRNSNSGDYNNDDEVAQWNAITTPLILSSTHIVRSSRWNWVNSTSILSLTSEMVLADGTVIPGINAEVGPGSFIDADPGNGEVLATGDGLPFVIEWEAGEEFYEGAGQIAGGPRVFFVAGSQEDTAAVPPIGRGEMNLMPEALAVFLDVVDKLVNVD